MSSLKGRYLYLLHYHPAGYLALQFTECCVHTLASFYVDESQTVDSGVIYIHHNSCNTQDNLVLCSCNTMLII